MSELEKFTQAFITVLLWLESDDEGDSLSDFYDESDLSEELKEKIQKDCKQFFNENYEIMVNASRDFPQHGHDFYLTRNGHGAGFWDRGYGNLGEILTEKCKSYGEINAYVGDDGLIYS